MDDTRPWRIWYTINHSGTGTLVGAGVHRWKYKNKSTAVRRAKDLVKNMDDYIYTYYIAQINPFSKTSIQYNENIFIYDEWKLVHKNKCILGQITMADLLQ